MTAIPLDEACALRLVCDGCGRTLDPPGAESGSGWLSLWRRAATVGWAGRNRPVGPHECPECAG